jgi:hypothetical protein
MASDIYDRKWVSRYSQPVFGIQVHKVGALADADANPVVGFLKYTEGDPDPQVLWTRTATRDSEGVYSITLTSAETQTPGPFSLGWTYDVDSVGQTYQIDIEIGQTSPEYDALNPDWKASIENVWIKFADLFDSPYGGPNLQVYIQTHFGRNRLAQLLPSALQRLNSATTPHATYEYNGDSFPFMEWGGLLSQSLYIEVLKHLIRSYTEIPEAILGTTVSRLDRRDYMSRWQTVYDLELEEFKLDLSRYRMAAMNLGYSSVLVAGGAYGNFGPQINAGGAGEAAARGYFYVGRWH